MARGIYEKSGAEPEAVENYQIAAQRGHAQALCEMGLRYYVGKGVEKNTSKGAECFVKASTSQQNPPLNPQALFQDFQVAMNQITNAGASRTQLVNVVLDNLAQIQESPIAVTTLWFLVNAEHEFFEGTKACTQLPPTEVGGLAQSGQTTEVVKPPRLNAHESKHLRSKSPSEDGGFYQMY